MRRLALLAALALAACTKGYDNPIVLGTLAAASAVEGGMSEAEEDRLNAENQSNVARLRASCAGIDARLGDLNALRPAAAEVERLGTQIGDDILSSASKACVGFHAEAAGHTRRAYALYFGAAINSLYERDWIAEHGGGPPKELSDRLHYGVLNAILRLRTAGQAYDIYHVGQEKVTGFTCARLRREAPWAATCR
jgi:hypothetical protein